jgi:hypothetical protein
VSGIIIGIMGQARAGKDTMANHLVKNYGFVRIALADEIKRIEMRLWDMTEEQCWGDDLKEVPDLRYPLPGKGHLTPRVGAQIIGTEVARSAYPDTWVRILQNNANAVLNGTHYYDRAKGILPNRRIRRFFSKKPAGIVVPDIRFMNEIDGIHKEGGVVIRVRRMGKIGDVGIKGHASEEEQKKIPDSAVDMVMQVPEGISTYHEAIDTMMVKVPRRRAPFRSVA